MRHFTVFLLTAALTLGSQPLFAQEDATTEPPQKVDTNDLLFKSLEYPELQVVPRASERVYMEAKAENQMGAAVHWPIHAASILTLYSGLTAGGSYRDPNQAPTAEEKEDSEYAALTATGIGAGWIVGSFLLHWMKPYQNSLSSIKKVKKEDRRSELLQERMAEESLEHQASLMKTLSLLAVATNLAANAWVAGSSSERSETIAVIGAGFSLIPLLFEHRHITAYSKHLEYKRKIYSPISSIQFVPNQETAQLEPQWTLSWSF